MAVQGTSSEQTGEAPRPVAFGGLPAELDWKVENLVRRGVSPSRKIHPETGLIHIDAVSAGHGQDCSIDLHTSQVGHTMTW